MTYVIAAACVADYSCLEVCPADCIHPNPDTPEFNRTEQLYIDPDACIDCAACVEACPVDAVYNAETIPDKWRHFVAINRDYFEGVTGA